MTDFDALSNDQLLSALDSLVASERRLLARVIGMLIEVEDRRLHLELAYPSMFAFCTSKLRLSEGEAYRRLLAARLARRFPEIIELIESGAIHLTALEILRDHLTEENRHDLLAAASHKTKAQVQALLAACAPKADAPSKIRKLPAPQPPLNLEPSVPPPAPRPEQKPRLEPLSPGRYKVQFTASEDLKRKLERAKDLLSHANPTRDLAVIVERAVDLLLGELEKTRRGKAKRARRRTPRRPGGSNGRAARATRREVFERDGDQCTYVGPDGKRCEATAFLELDHVDSRALGGGDESHNLRVRCRAHNRLWAEQTFGKQHVARSIHLRQRKCAPKNERFDDAAESQKWDKLLGALTHSGFAAKQAKIALERIRRGDGPVAWSSSIEELLRAALQSLT
jgi:5-methylcytosine-specific restriction endonuclease McrA